jgi:chitinase
VNLSWDAATDNVGVTGYRVYRDGVRINAVNVATTAYSDATVAPVTSYSYTVTAVDAADNESAPSAPALVTSAADTFVPQPPTALTATAASHTQVTLNWSGASDNVGVTGYQIFRDGAAAPVATIGASPTTYTDGDLTPATTYTYAVAAVDAAGNVSAESVAATTTTPVFSDGFESDLSRWSRARPRSRQTTTCLGRWAGRCSTKTPPLTAAGAAVTIKT